MPSSSVLLSTAYFAPIPFYALTIKSVNIYIEQFENYTKQTFRNRCEILGANGIISLIVPVVKSRKPKILIKDLRISYDVDWQRNHWRTIFSAYGSSPYLDYFKDDIFPLFEVKEKFLLDYNLKIHDTICELLEIENNTILTSDFEKNSEDFENFREVISPKNKLINHQFQNEKYTQVFSEKTGFIPNLSILDLLFNEGPNSFSIMANCIVNVKKPVK
ncbi:MAG: WbqC family protein [Bacteroidales bacterium]|jgi:hypothetical protein|nr:WbqC family protein [Bacteroidales bacterium]